VHEIILTDNFDMNIAASKLYSALHELDHLELDVIIAEKVPNIGLGKSINDRLKRASS
jgi:L-threonylcarbamoyladenylate synthase